MGSLRLLVVVVVGSVGGVVVAGGRCRLSKL